MLCFVLLYFKEVLKIHSFNYELLLIQLIFSNNVN